MSCTGILRGWLVGWSLRHVMKVRYTSLQADVRTAEERYPELADVASVSEMPVVAASLHSQVAGVAVAFKHLRPDARLVYVMTDGVVADRHLGARVAVAGAVAARRDGHVRAGVRRGPRSGVVAQRPGDREARRAGRRGCRRDGARKRGNCDPPRFQRDRARLGARRHRGSSAGIPIAVTGTRADPRDRHRGVSHHSITALLTATRSRVGVAVPEGSWSDVCARSSISSSIPRAVTR